MGSVGEDAQASLGYGATATATATTTATGSGNGYGYGYGDGYGFGDGYGNSSGYGDGYGNGYGNGSGNGYGDTATATATATATGGLDLHERPRTPGTSARPAGPTGQQHATGRWWRLTDGTVDGSRHGPCPDEWWHACPAAGSSPPDYTVLAEQLRAVKHYESEDCWYSCPESEGGLLQRRPNWVRLPRSDHVGRRRCVEAQAARITELGNGAASVPAPPPEDASRSRRPTVADAPTPTRDPTKHSNSVVGVPCSTTPTVVAQGHQRRRCRVLDQACPLHGALTDV